MSFETVLTAKVAPFSRFSFDFFFSLSSALAPFFLALPRSCDETADKSRFFNLANLFSREAISVTSSGPIVVGRESSTDPLFSGTEHSTERISFLLADSPIESDLLLTGKYGYWPADSVGFSCTKGPDFSIRFGEDCCCSSTRLPLTSTRMTPSLTRLSLSLTRPSLSLTIESPFKRR